MARVKKYKKKTGSRRQVWNGTAKQTQGGLKRKDLYKDKYGSLQSRKSMKKSSKTKKNKYRKSRKSSKKYRKSSKKSRKYKKSRRYKRRSQRGGHQSYPGATTTSGVGSNYDENTNTGASSFTRSEIQGGLIDSNRTIPHDSGDGTYYGTGQDTARTTDGTAAATEISGIATGLNAATLYTKDPSSGQLTANFSTGTNLMFDPAAATVAGADGSDRPNPVKDVVGAGGIAGIKIGHQVPAVDDLNTPDVDESLQHSR